MYVLLLVTKTHDFFGPLGLQPSALLVQARVPCWTCSAASWCRCLDLPGKLLARPRPAFIRMRTVSLSWEDEGKHHGHGLMRVLWSWWYYYRYYMICIIHAYFNHTFVYVHKCECHHWQAVDSKVFTVYFLRFEPLHLPDRQVLVVAWLVLCFGESLPSSISSP